MATLKPRFSITIDEELLDRINHHQRANKFATQNKAILDLVQIGLDELKNESPNAADELTNNEMVVLGLIRSLNAKGQKKVIDYALDLQASGLYSKDTENMAI